MIPADSGGHDRHYDQINASAILKVEAETPESAQGDTEARPSPAPNARRVNETAAATTAPAAMLAHEIAETDSARADDSFRT
jgi:hypothetical protein